MKRLILNLLLPSILLVVNACSSKEECYEALCSQNESEFIFKIDPDFELGDTLTSLDSLESISIPLVIDSIKGGLTRADIVAFQGSIENLGSQHVAFLPNSGMNIVPSYLCGSGLSRATISTVYRLTLTIDLGNNLGARGFEGEKSGWSGIYLSNPQVQEQRTASSDSSQAKYQTFCYHIRSTNDGWTLPNGGLVVPFPLEDIRLYAKVYEI